MSALALAAVMVAHLKSLDGYDAPYVDADDITDTVIDGRVDMIALSEVIIQHMEGAE